MAGRPQSAIAEEWLNEDNLLLLECWSRDGYTLTDIANRIGINVSTVLKWRDKYPEIDQALKNGREIVDYKVENALLKSALGYKTKETKITTVMKDGKIVETRTETTEVEKAPNVTAIQSWLYNRLPDKWKRKRDNVIELDDEDTTIHVTVTRASNDEVNKKEQDEEVNNEIEIRKKTEEELKEEKAKKSKSKKSQNKPVKRSNKPQNTSNKPENENSTKEENLDAWPDDWIDE